MHAEGQCAVFNLTSQKRVRRLQTGDRCDLLQAGEPRVVAIRGADEPDLALALKRAHGVPRVLELPVSPGRGALGPRRPTKLVEIDAVDVESPEAGFGLSPDGRRSEVVHDVAEFIPYQAAGGEDIRAFGLRKVVQGAADDGFGAAESIDSGCVDPVDP